jgi:hypothetical protein
LPSLFLFFTLFTFTYIHTRRSRKNARDGGREYIRRQYTGKRPREGRAGRGERKSVELLY